MHTLFNRSKTFANSAGFRRYFKNTSWLFFGRIINMIVGFIATTYMIRMLGPESYGTLSYVISFAGLGSVIANLGIDQILSRDIIAHREKRPELLGTAFVIKLIGACIALITVLLGSMLSGNTVEVTLLITLLSSSFIFSAFNIFNTLFQADVASKYPTIVSIAVTGTLSTLKIIAVYTGLPIFFLVCVFFLENVLYAVGFTYIYIKHYGLRSYRFIYKASVARTLLKESWPLIVSGAFVAIYARIDQIMLGNIIDQKAVGFYDAAVRIAELWYFLPGIITASLFPALMNAHTTNTDVYSLRLGRLYALLFWIAAGITGAVIIAAPYIITLLYGPAYSDSIGVLRLYVGGTIPIFLIAVMNQHLIAERQAKTLFATSFVGMILNVLLNILLIPSYGIYGAALATLISYSSIPLSLFLFKKTRGHGIVMLTSLVKIR